MNKKGRPVISSKLGSMKRMIFCLLLFLVLSFSGAWGADVKPLTEYDRLFMGENGWTGGDGACSIPLSENRILWLFGDTLIGSISEGKRGSCVLINNSIAIQEGIQVEKAAVKFFYPTTSEGKPAAFLRPEDGKGWLWPAHGIRTPKALYLFLMQMEATGDSSVFGFRHIGSWLAVIKNPDDPPDQWRIAQKKIPWAVFLPGKNLFFGASLLRDGKDVYIYGISEESGKDNPSKAMILAKAPEGSLGYFGTWRFYSGGEWVKDYRDAEDLCPGIATEYSVSLRIQETEGRRQYGEMEKQYILITSGNAFSGEILARTAPQPWGPWGKNRLIYRCPEIKGGQDIFCYAAKAHPELSGGGGLIITYAANSTNFARLTDASLYRPRFLYLALPGFGK